MAKHALSLFLKIMLFSVVMLIVAKVIPYDGLVSFNHRSFWFPQRPSFYSFHTRWIRFRSVGIVTYLLRYSDQYPDQCSCYEHDDHRLQRHDMQVNPANLFDDWILSTLRRLVKVFAFTFLFWALFRFLPYSSVFTDGETYPAFIIAATVAFNLLLTTACYWFIMNKITTKRGL